MRNTAEAGFGRAAIQGMAVPADCHLGRLCHGAGSRSFRDPEDLEGPVHDAAGHRVVSVMSVRPMMRMAPIAREYGVRP